MAYTLEMRERNHREIEFQGLDPDDSSWAIVTERMTLGELQSRVNYMTTGQNTPQTNAAQPQSPGGAMLTQGSTRPVSTYIDPRQFYSDGVAPLTAWTTAYENLVSEYLDPTRKEATKPKKRKVPKLRKNVSEAEIATAISKHSKKQLAKLYNHTKTIAAQIEQGEAMVEENNRQMKRNKNILKFFESQADNLMKSRKEIHHHFQKVIQELKENEQIADITIDTSGRIIITTTPLTVQKNHWEEPKTIGQFQIRIDFSKDAIADGVRVLNITQRYGVYDSPTINHTSCCWGNIANDITREFLTQDLVELVEDLIAYCSSPNEEHGFLGRMNEDNESVCGWDTWFSDLVKWKEDYNWELYEKEHPEKAEGRDEDIMILNAPPRLPIDPQTLVVGGGIGNARSVTFSEAPRNALGFVANEIDRLSRPLVGEEELEVRTDYPDREAMTQQEVMERRIRELEESLQEEMRTRSYLQRSLDEYRREDPRYTRPVQAYESSEVLRIRDELHGAAVSSEGTNLTEGSLTEMVNRITELANETPETPIRP